MSQRIGCQQALVGKYVSIAVATGVFAASAFLYLRPALRFKNKKPGRIAIAPKCAELPSVGDDVAVEQRPYPCEILPGGRDVDTPYGTIRVFEWGAEDGEKVLLMHGIGTPSLALQNMADALIARGYRIMLFDFFGRGYSDAPTDLPYDARLYTTQILLVLASSDLSWTGRDAFHLAGYSLGGAIAASFARYYPRMVRSLTLVCPGGLIRASHLSWHGKLLYSEGIFPESWLRFVVRRRLRPRDSDHVTDVTEAEVVQAQDEEGVTRLQRSFDDVVLSEKRPSTTVADVVRWQLDSHPGFVHAYMSTIRNAPIYEQHDWDWAVLRRLLADRRSVGGDVPGLKGGRMCLVLAESDPVVLKEEFVSDARAVLGEDAVVVVGLEGGHEVAITKGAEIAGKMIEFWDEHSIA